MPKLRMFAGPNGSGKSTLFDHLRRHYSFPWGHYLNPDELDRTLRESHRLEFGPWDVNVTAVKLKKFIRDHPLAAAGRPSGLSVRGNVLRFEKPDSTGYFAAIVSDFLRRVTQTGRLWSHTNGTALKYINCSHTGCQDFDWLRPFFPAATRAALPAPHLDPLPRVRGRGERSRGCAIF